MNPTQAHGTAEPVSFDALVTAVAPTGLTVRGAFSPTGDDAVPQIDGKAAATLVLLGNVGASMWSTCSQSSYFDGRPDPLDDWSRAVIGQLAGEFGALALFPFEGPPFHPFLRWAQRCEPVFPSMMGPLIHREFGLWHAYRGALGFAAALVNIPVSSASSGNQSLCDTCEDKPCLTTCPVGALTQGHYDVPRCVQFLHSDAGKGCMQHGCAARRACPVGVRAKYGLAQANHHMRVFVRNR